MGTPRKNFSYKIILSIGFLLFISSLLMMVIIGYAGSVNNLQPWIHGLSDGVSLQIVGERFTPDKTPEIIGAIFFHFLLNAILFLFILRRNLLGVKITSVFLVMGSFAAGSISFLGIAALFVAFSTSTKEYFHAYKLHKENIKNQGSHP